MNIHGADLEIKASKRNPLGPGGAMDDFFEGGFGGGGGGRELRSSTRGH